MKILPVLRSISICVICSLACSGRVTGQDIITKSAQTFGYGTLTTFAVSADGMQFVTGGSRGAFLWDIELERVVERFQANNMEEVRSLAVSSDASRLLTASRDRVARLWDVTAGQLLREFEGHDFWSPPALSPDGQLLLTVAEEIPEVITVRLWDVSTGEVLHTFEESPAIWASVAFSLDGSQVIGGFSFSLDLGMRRWNVETGHALQATEVIPTGWLSLPPVVSPDRLKMLVFGQKDGGPSSGFAQVWDIATGQPISTYVDPRVTGIDVALFAPDGGAVLLGADAGLGLSGEYSLWDYRDNLITHSFEAGEPLLPTGIRFVPDGKSVLMATVPFSTSIQMWDIGTGEMLRSFEGHTAGIKSVAFTPDRTKVLTGGGGGAKLWDVTTGLAVEVFNPSHNVKTVDISSDGSLIVTAIDPLGLDLPEIHVWDAETGDPLRTISSGYVDSVDVSPDGSKLLTTRNDSQGGFAEVWDVASGRQLLSIPCDSDSVGNAVFSPDGSKVLTGTVDYPSAEQPSAQMWDANTGLLLQNYEGATEAVLCVAFSPNTTEVLTGGHDHLVRVWDADTGEALRTYEHDSGVRSIDFSPDGARLLTACNDGKARIWDYHSGDLLKVIVTPADHCPSTVFSPNGTHILTADGDVARLWNVSDPIRLQIAVNTTGGVVLTWEDSEAALQRCPDLSSAEWGDLTVDEPGRYEISNPGEQALFYRLQSP